jgi:hypothetical protein
MPRSPSTTSRSRLNRQPLRATEDDATILVIVIAALEYAKSEAAFKKKTLVRERIQWPIHAERLLIESEFKKYYRMSYASFEALLRIVGPNLKVDYYQSLRRSSGVPPICPAGMLQCTVSWLGGGSHHHIRIISGVSRATFYRIVYRVMNAINDSKGLDLVFPANQSQMRSAADGFLSQTENKIIGGCIGVIDGWLCPIRVPRRTECGRVLSFFSGHYQRYGLNIQACADHLSRFTAVSINSPGGMNDALAFQRWHLSKFLQKIPDGYFVIGDNAYVQTRVVLTPYNKAQLDGRPDRHNYNFFVSQLRIRVEMAFGLLVNKWRILKRPLCVKLRNCRIVVMAAMRLHNFCISQRVLENETDSLRQIRGLIQEVRHWNNGEANEFHPSTVELSDGTHISILDERVRSDLVEHIASHNLQRPERNIARNGANI